MTTDPAIWAGWAWLQVHEGHPVGWVLQQAHPNCKDPLDCWATLVQVERDTLALSQGTRTASEVSGRPLALAHEVKVELEGKAKRAAEALAWGD